VHLLVLIECVIQITKHGMNNTIVYVLKVQGGDNKLLQNLGKSLSGTRKHIQERQISSRFIDVSS